VLQPGVDCLSGLAKRGQFPRPGLFLSIADGDCEDSVEIAFDHAFLLPEGRRLPFAPSGELFAVK
jgi:hypothetical protein